MRKTVQNVKEACFVWFAESLETKEIERSMEQNTISDLIFFANCKIIILGTNTIDGITFHPTYGNNQSRLTPIDLKGNVRVYTQLKCSCLKLC